MNDEPDLQRQGKAFSIEEEIQMYNNHIPPNLMNLNSLDFLNNWIFFQYHKL